MKLAKTVLTDARIFASGADLTGASSKCELSVEVEDKDTTTFGSAGWGEVIGGTRSGSVAASGYWEAGDPGMVDDTTWATLGRLVPFTIGPTSASVGSLAYFLKAFKSNYKLFGQVGDVAPWEANASSSWPVVRGRFAHSPGVLRSSSGNGSATQLVAVPAGHHLYAALHVLSASGDSPQITVTVETDTDSDFLAPETVLTFTPASSASSEILRTNGAAIETTWFRVSWTVAGTDPTFTFVSALGVA